MSDKLQLLEMLSGEKTSKTGVCVREGEERPGWGKFELCGEFKKLTLLSPAKLKNQ